MSRKTRKLQFPHSSLLLEKIPQEREKHLRKWEEIEENEEEDRSKVLEGGDADRYLMR